MPSAGLDVLPTKGLRKAKKPIMAVAMNSFDSWLSKKLQALNTDEGVFGSYIKGILEGDETEDEKTEALEGILAGITVRSTRIVRLEYACCS